MDMAQTLYEQMERFYMALECLVEGHAQDDENITSFSSSDADRQGRLNDIQTIFGILCSKLEGIVFFGRDGLKSTLLETRVRERRGYAALDMVCENGGMPFMYISEPHGFAIYHESPSQCGIYVVERMLPTCLPFHLLTMHGSELSTEPNKREALGLTAADCISMMQQTHELVASQKHS